MKFVALVLVSVLCLYVEAGPLVELQDKEDEYLTLPEIIAKYGYPVEEHFVTTEDGYILRLHRIPHGKNSNKNNGKVVFLMHGLICSSADWVIGGVDHALSYQLANAGFDVWMGNERGNKLSRNHTHLNPDTSREFWQFSWHEVGIIDLPTMIDYVLGVTKQSNLYYVGHSQGNTAFYVMTSMLPEYNAKIKTQISLAPIAYVNHMTSPLMRFLALFTGPLEILTGLIGLNEFLPSNKFMEIVGDLLCGDDDFTQFLCTNALFAICGFSPKEMNATLLPVLMGHTPAGASVKQLYHYSQEILSGHFRQFDYGPLNLIKYGTFGPPEYNLDAITTPIHLLYSYNDWMASTTDVERLCTNLGEDVCKELYLVSDSGFNHMDYLYGIHAVEYVYPKVISIINDN